MNWLQIRLFGPYLSSFSANSYGYYSQMSQNPFSNGQTFASALVVRRAARGGSTYVLHSESSDLSFVASLVPGLKMPDLAATIEY